MKNKIALLFIFILGISLYALTLKGVNYNVQPSDIKNKLDQTEQPLELSPERGRFAHVIALADEHTYALDQQLGDAVYPDVGYHNGKFFSFFAPGISYLAVPFYKLGERYNLSQVFTFGFISLVAVLALMFLFKIARDILKLPIWASLAAVIIFAFGCSSWSYAVTLYQHLVTVFFIVSSFYAVWKYKQGTRWGWLWAMFVWINYALAISIDYPNAVLMLPVMAYFFIVSIRVSNEEEKYKISLRPAIVATFVAFCVITGLHFYHNTYYFGSWKNLSSTLPSVKTLVEQAATTTPVTVGEKSAVGFFKETNLVKGFSVLGGSTDRGILLYAPIFLLALFGFWSVRKVLNLEYGILLALIITNFFLYSSWGDPWGGWAFGPRYLIPSMAILSLFIGVWLANTRFRAISRIVTFLLFMYSSAIALLGVLTTNAVPPKVEAVPLNIGFNFLRNWQLFKEGRSSSFVYNTYLADRFTLKEYFIILYGVLLLVMIVILFVIPLFTRHDHKDT